MPETLAQLLKITTWSEFVHQKVLITRHYVWTGKRQGRTIHGMESVVIGNTGARGLKSTRARLGLTLDDVSALTGLSVPFLSRLERDKRRLTGETAGRLARSLNVPVRSIIGLPEDAA